MPKKQLASVTKRLLKDSFDGDQISDAKIQNVVNAIKKLPYPYSLIVLSSYKKLLQTIIDQKTLTIESASKLTDTEIKQVQNHYVSNFELMYTNVSVNEALIAGVRVKAGDTLVDATIRGNINNLRVLAQ
jgi:F0F1-type ATP synthase delta subunit